ncbi:GlcG/HbpS family heme-binding protein [Castellaniella sp.]|uniref:GlcG/HbpS family heme-binding protein n=1 Tax=Castellaniella sp. TaxID=1955812 RepID=UPI003A902DC4
MNIRIPVLAASVVLLSSPVLANDLTYTSQTLTPEAAMQVVQGAMKSCRDSGYQVTVAVTDRTGVPIALMRDRYAGAHTTEAATRKAYTAANFRMDTVDLAQSTEAGQPTSGIRFVGQLLALGGGLPIQAAGAVVGGVGVSGAPGGDLDRACAQAGIDVIQDNLDF